MDERTEILVKGALCLLAVPLTLWLARRDEAANRRSPPANRAVWLVAAGVALVAYCNFGAFHGTGFVHHWEQFHYFLGSKYFRELGYDGLYQASLAAQWQSRPVRTTPPEIRDLRTNQVVETLAATDHRREVVERFTPRRWQQFVADHDRFLDHMSDDYLSLVRRDHGFNATPTWTFVGRLATAWLPATPAVLTMLGLLDPLLLMLAFGCVFHTYGARTGGLVTVLFGLGYPWRFYWVGGALLRFDWLAALIVAVCMAHRGRYRWSGALLAYACLVRLFPAALLLGPAVLAVRSLARGERPLRSIRWAQGFALAAVLGLGAGCLAGRGAAAWSQFAGDIALHRGTWLTNNVGLENLLLYGPQTMRRELVDWSRPEPWERWQEKMSRWHEERRGWLALVQLLFLALAVVAAWRSPPDQALLIGFAAVFALFLLTCYYWAMLALVPILGRRVAVAALLAINAGLYALHLGTPSFEMIFGTASWAFALFFLGWLATAWRAGRGEPRGEPGSA